MYKLYISRNIPTCDLLRKHNLNNEIIYNKYGKPYFKDNPIFFNVSHSDKYAVLAVSDKEIGVDIQKITYKAKIINKICNENEKKLIKNANDFTKIWVKKESFVKMVGQGLSYGLINADTQTINNIKIKKYKNYYIAICLK
ncbi:MAG: 4'-phosphopantetheinyl transferase superfamily protein [Bacilli bacterium]|nr:4'-phosphopantetheinyl transferase superfamily protein [Bacilli bacterium]